ncbi:MAG: SGNH/GDSL hydrolase family protein [Amylibacter sp.]
MTGITLIKINGYFLVASLFLSIMSTTAMSANKFKSPDILVLGDSQFTFGSGPSFLDFFQNIKSKCSPNAAQMGQLKKLGDMSVAVIGVRSSSLPSWTARSGKGKGAICDVDPKWKVNAGSYGTVNKTKNIYIQIGKGPQYQFCKKKLSPFEALFKDKYYDPKLLVMSFLGNSSSGWANSPKMALNDVQKTMAQLPDDLPCIFMTSAPAYNKETNDLRVRAQKNLKKAFQKSGSRCSFVEGLTPKTIAANLGNKNHFRRKKSGAVKDPYHPNKKAAKKFFAIEKNNICAAIFTQVSK